MRTGDVDNRLGPSSMRTPHLLSAKNKNCRGSSHATVEWNADRTRSGFPPRRRALALHAVTLTGAALGAALIRRYLVTHWGLSTFPGSGLFSCRRLT